MRTDMRSFTGMAAMTVLTGLLLAGCADSGSTDAQMDGAPASAPRAAGGEGESRALSGAGTTSGRQAPDESGVTKVAPGGPPGATTGAPAVADGETRAVVYTADLRIEVKKIDAGVAEAKRLVLAAGGHIANETSSTRPATASISFRIPADKYGTVLDQLSGRIGTRLHLQQQAEDVTAEVADVQSRVKSAQSALASFRKLLDRANTIGEVLNVEQEISRREADLEALQARQKALAQQTRYATVDMTFAGPDQPAPDEHEEGGFIGGIKAGWEAVTNLLSGLALVIGWLVPFTPLAALIIAIVLWLRRRGVIGPRRDHAQSGTAQSGGAQSGTAQSGGAQSGTSHSTGQADAGQSTGHG